MTPAPGAESSWTLFATSEPLTGISGSSSSDVYGLGVEGTLFHRDGHEWTATIPFEASFHGTGLWCVSPHDRFVTGYSRRLVAGAWTYDYSLYHLDGSVATPVQVNLTGPIHDLWSVSENDVYVGGAAGMILHYDGSSWRPMESGTSQDILAIHGLPTGELFAGFEHSVRYYDGTAWTEVLSTHETLLDIWAASRNEVYAAVKEHGAILRYNGQAWQVRAQLPSDIERVFIRASDDVWAVSGFGSIHHFDGVNWQMTPLPIRTLVIDALWGSSKTDIFAVGNGDDDQVGPTILHFDGSAWSRESIDSLLPFNRELTALSGNAEEIHVGGDFMALLRFDGMLWKRDTGDDAGHISDIWSGPGKSLVAIGDGGHDAAFFDETDWTIRTGAMVSSSGDEGVWASGLNDVVFVGALGEIEHFDGSTFRRQESHTTVLLNDVWGRSNADVYAAGDSGTVVHYDGQSWQRMETNTTAHLWAIWGDAKIAVAVGDRGTILHLTEGKWLQVSSPSGASLTGVWGTSPRNIYAISDRSLLHFDGWRWSLVPDAPGGKRIWGRASDDLYILGTEPANGDASPRFTHSYRILHYGPSPWARSERVPR